VEATWDAWLGVGNYQLFSDEDTFAVFGDPDNQPEHHPEQSCEPENQPVNNPADKSGKTSHLKDILSATGNLIMFSYDPKLPSSKTRWKASS
jgi:hypothetical protein